MKISSSAGKLAEPGMLVDIPKLISSYYTQIPDLSDETQKVIFGTSGHRGSSLDGTFNEWHILAISEAICRFRKLHDISGPLFIGIDTHALSWPAYISALEVFSAHGITVMTAANDAYTPTPVISHAILKYNRKRKEGFADGVVITPSHNPPRDGGFKYNTVNGGPSSTIVSGWIQQQANEILKTGKNQIKRISFEKARRASTTYAFDFINNYINELDEVIDFDVIRNSAIRIGVDPMGGAGVQYWEPIAEKYRINLSVINQTVDPTFRFMTVDWDGNIRMDPSSPYAMKSLIDIKDKFDISFACDTDHDRHGIVTRSTGLMPPNHYLSSALYFLLENRKAWNSSASVGKTIVTSGILEKIASHFQHTVFETPVGFKWFAEGLADRSICFAGEESAGASFLKINGNTWTTDKDGMTAALLSAEITASEGRDPGIIYGELIKKFGGSYFDRTEAAATPEQKKLIATLSPLQIKQDKMAGEKIKNVFSKVPETGEAIGGIKVITENGWFVARPSGTEDIYKIYAESFKNENHLNEILEEGQDIVNKALHNN
jgi:phosphoglucomutase